MITIRNGTQRAAHGFTLLEMLLSISIVVSALLLLVNFILKMNQNNEVQLASQEINTILNAAVQYHDAYQQWPVNLTVLKSFIMPDTVNANFCSPWRDSSGCRQYKVTASTHYFALEITPPNQGMAVKLVASLNNAYMDSQSNAVTAYINTSIGLGVLPRPPGVLYAATNKQLNGSCVDISGNAIPFDNCISASSTPSTAYGLINVTNWPVNTIRSGYNFGNREDYAAAKFSTAGVTPACPAGTLPTLVSFPAGVWPIDESASAVTSSSFSYVNAHFIMQNTAAPIYEPCIRSAIGNGNDTGNGITTNYWAGFADIVCLDPSKVANWPDIPGFTNTCGPPH